MADEDQERFEDYIELERYIEGLQAGKDAKLPMDLTPEQARIYQMAALFRSASPENAEPRTAFAEQLKTQLLNAREDAPAPIQADETSLQEQDISPLSVTKPEPIRKPGIARPVRFFSRRGLLTGGAVAAASLVIGAGATHLIEQNLSSHNDTTTSTTSTPSNTRIEIGTTIPTTWHFVTTLDTLGESAVRFTTDTLVGYVLRVNDTTQGEQIIALSAACTHMGCIVRWQDSDRRFHCPCHTAVFADDGTHIRLNYRPNLPPLPRLNIKIEVGKVYVEVPL
jgi:cytochrome b6-f complex iron-sulfur subunit